MLFARSQVVAAAVSAKVQALDAPSGDLSDFSALAGSTRRGKSLGFTGRACIHPSQLEAVNRVYTPSAEEQRRAQLILQAFEGGAGRFEGRLIERPVVLAAQRVLARPQD